MHDASYGRYADDVCALYLIEREKDCDNDRTKWPIFNRYLIASDDSDKNDLSSCYIENIVIANRQSVTSCIPRRSLRFTLALSALLS